MAVPVVVQLTTTRHQLHQPLPLIPLNPPPQPQLLNGFPSSYGNNFRRQYILISLTYAFCQFVEFLYIRYNRVFRPYRVLYPLFFGFCIVERVE